jgi:hypothetical protein
LTKEKISPILNKVVRKSQYIYFPSIYKSNTKNAAFFSNQKFDILGTGDFISGIIPDFILRRTNFYREKGCVIGLLTIPTI